MAREALLWAWMHEQGRGIPMLDMRRVENLLAKGTPDVDLCFWGNQAWVELKGCNAPVRPTSKLVYHLDRMQALWLKGRWAVGGSAWLYFRVGTGRGIRRYLVPGSQAEHLEDCVTEGALAGMSVVAPGHGFGHFLSSVSQRGLWPMAGPEGAANPLVVHDLPLD